MTSVSLRRYLLATSEIHRDILFINNYLIWKVIDIVVFVLIGSVQLTDTTQCVVLVPGVSDTSGVNARSSCRFLQLQTTHSYKNC